MLLCPQHIHVISKEYLILISLVKLRLLYKTGVHLLCIDHPTEEHTCACTLSIIASAGMCALHDLNSKTWIYSLKSDREGQHEQGRI